jgi:hypothetical protein
MQAFPHVSLQQSFLEVKIRAYLALLPRRSACGVFRMSQRRAAIAETCGKLYNLYDKQHGIRWWWPTHCFHSAHTVRTERVETDTILPGYQMFRQLGL